MANWVYDFTPKENSEEAKTLAVLSAKSNFLD
jgi:hypothetical protein